LYDDGQGFGLGLGVGVGVALGVTTGCGVGVGADVLLPDEHAVTAVTTRRSRANRRCTSRR
jgi:hypothetical protein